jgi:hypothetical protein
MPNSRPVLYPFALLLIMGASSARGEDPTASRREQFLNLMLRGDDPITERAKERSLARRLSSAAPSHLGAAPSSPMIPRAAPLAATLGKPSAASQSSLEQKAARLQKRLARIEWQEEQLRLAYPPKSGSESKWLRHSWAVVLHNQQQTTAALYQTEKQLASPTTPSVAIDALRLTAATRARLRVESPAPKARRRDDVAKPDRHDR